MDINTIEYVWIVLDYTLLILTLCMFIASIVWPGVFLLHIGSLLTIVNIVIIKYRISKIQHHIGNT